MVTMQGAAAQPIGTKSRRMQRQASFAEASTVRCSPPATSRPIVMAAVAARIAAGVAVVYLQAAPLAWSQGAEPAPSEITIQACRPQTSCVSTASFLSPSQYLAPWSYQPSSQESAFRALVHELEDRHAAITAADPSSGLIAAELPSGSGRVQLPLPGASDDVDELQFIVRPDGVVVFRSEARRARPDAPFCLTRGCISGAANRQSMEALRDALGWSVYGETDEDKQWVQILLH